MKLFLNLDDGMDPTLRAELSRRLQRVSVNPMENDSRAEMEMANRQYQALLTYAFDPEGLERHLFAPRRIVGKKLFGLRTVDFGAHERQRFAYRATHFLLDRGEIGHGSERTWSVTISQPPSGRASRTNGLR